MTLKNANLAGILSASILLTLATGCATNTTSLIRREVSYNPLPKMQEYAEANGYDVKQDDPNHLHVRKNVTTWLRMIGEGAGIDYFVGEYNYTNGVLAAEVWLEMRELLKLYMSPNTVELKPQFRNRAWTPAGRKCANAMLKAGGLKPEWE
jgi:hypothetical protein